MSFDDASVHPRDQAILRKVNDNNLKLLLHELHSFVMEAWDAARCVYGVGISFQ